MRVIVTGQVGVDKGEYLEGLRELARGRGKEIGVFHVGQMMYAEAPDVPAGRILNLPITRLNSLRRAVFKEIQNQAREFEHVVVNTHATFRWKHGLFAAFDYDQIHNFNADCYVTLMDNAENVHQRLMRDHGADHSLKDVMVWREEEALATEVVANIAKGYGRFYVLSRGRKTRTIGTLYRLLFEPLRKRAYLSYPMSHVGDRPEILAEIEAFKAAIDEVLTTFDPGDVDEYLLHVEALRALAEGRGTLEVEAAGGRLVLKTTDVAQISNDILGQIYARDFKMIDQSQMIVSLIPTMDGKPAISSGVERELQHAFEGGREVYVIWTGSGAPSPFVTKTATKVFGSVAEAVSFFRG